MYSCPLLRVARSVACSGSEIRFGGAPASRERTLAIDKDESDSAADRGDARRTSGLVGKHDEESQQHRRSVMKISWTVKDLQELSFETVPGKFVLAPWKCIFPRTF